MVKTILIGCGIFQEEIEHIISQDESLNLEIKWLEVGLHDNIERLENVLTKTISTVKEPEKAKILFGKCCLPNMGELAEKMKVETLGARN
ncbi:MAG: hypothetical protein ACRCTY_08440, partial [Candidatus Adiutrix sp.]